VAIEKKAVARDGFLARFERLRLAHGDVGVDRALLAFGESGCLGRLQARF
jgi:hypothetical protein